MWRRWTANLSKFDEMTKNRRLRSIALIQSATLALGLALASAQPALAADDVLRVAIPARPPGLGNPFAAIPVGAVNPAHVMFDTLTVIGERGSVLPSLAVRWRADGELAWEFDLRTDVTFSNGERFDARSVADTLEFLISDAANSYVVAGELSMIAGATAIDADTVRVVTRTPDAILPNRLSFVAMVPMQTWAKIGPTEFGLRPVGTGPFKLRDWGMDSGRIVLDRNEASWRNPGQFRELHFAVVPDVLSRMQALLGDQVDLTVRLSLDLLDELAAAGLKIQVVPTYSIGAWAFRQTDGASVVADPRVRRALNLAVDRKAISDSVFKGYAEPASQVANTDVFGFNPELAPYPYDPDGARALLKEAGLASGLDLDVIVRSDASVPESVLVAQIVAQNLAAVGVRVKLRRVPGQQWLKMYFSGDWAGAQVMEISFNNSLYGDAIRAIETASCLKPGAFYCDESQRALIAASNRDFDRGSRERRLQELGARLHQDPPAIYLFPYLDSLAYHRRLGTLPRAGQRLVLEKITTQAP